MILCEHSDSRSKLPLVLEAVIGIIILRNENLVYSLIDGHTATQTDTQSERRLLCR